MRYPYYNPNLTFSVILKALFISSSRAEKEIERYFRNLTGKKYILITNSCRSALYLAYKSIGITGEVITSPLTCKVAIDPIIESGNTPVFADIRVEDLNINPSDISQKISHYTFAIQAIHLGGNSCEMIPIMNIARRHKLWIIEDCAQSLGAKYQSKNTGSFGDIACFSLIKNAYGIGGGILATDNQEIFLKALSFQNALPFSSKFVTFYRIIRNLAETYRSFFLGLFFHRILMTMKGKKSAYFSIKKQLSKNPKWASKISAIQLTRIAVIHLKRKEIGKTYYNLLKSNNLIVNYLYNPDECSFTKLFVYSPRYQTVQLIEKLTKAGVEVMHLEHKYGSPFQEKIVSAFFSEESVLNNYQKTHDSVLSLPVNENYKKSDLENIIRILNKALN